MLPWSLLFRLAENVRILSLIAEWALSNIKINQRRGNWGRLLLVTLLVIGPYLLQFALYPWGNLSPAFTTAWATAVWLRVSETLCWYQITKDHHNSLFQWNNPFTELERRRQDDGIEGLEFTSSQRNTNITTNYWATIYKTDRTLPKKKKYSTSKDKEEAMARW